MHPALRLVNDRLPQVGDQAGRLFDNDDVFRELCDEYQMCSEVAVQMEEEASGPRRALRMEYAALRLRLEAELLRYLAEHPEG
jgi:hypothetical protein